MNREAVRTEINSIISDLHIRIGGRAARKQYAPAKHQIVKLTELGIIDLMPAKFGYTDAAAVIEAATDSGKTVGGFNAYGEGDVTNTPASKLYTLLNEVEETVIDLVVSEIHEETAQPENNTQFAVVTVAYDANHENEFEAQSERRMHYKAVASYVAAIIINSANYKRLETGVRWNLENLSVLHAGYHLIEFSRSGGIRVDTMAYELPDVGSAVKYVVAAMQNAVKQVKNAK